MRLLSAATPDASRPLGFPSCGKRPYPLFSTASGLRSIGSESGKSGLLPCPRLDITPRLASVQHRSGNLSSHFQQPPLRAVAFYISLRPVLHSALPGSPPTLPPRQFALVQNRGAACGEKAPPRSRMISYDLPTRDATTAGRGPRKQRRFAGRNGYQP